MSGTDQKWQQLAQLIQSPDPELAGQKIIIFTEHLATLNYLQDKIITLLGDSNAVITIQGAMDTDKRRDAERRFKDIGKARILIATDAAGEGINLQCAHLMINWDLPWNPNRLEQRFGRIHRIGQKKTCYLFNLVSIDTREGQVYTRLLEKITEEKGALKGKVFDILGTVTYGKSKSDLTQLIIEAVRTNNIADINRKIDQAYNPEKINKLLQDNALTADTMSVARAKKTDTELTRWQAHKLQPYFIETFFIAAFKELGGIISPRERGRWEITKTPAAVKDMNRAIKSSYQRICFDRRHITAPDKDNARLIAPGEALLTAVIALILEQRPAIFTQSTVLIADTDNTNEPRLLMSVESSLKDGGGKVISRRLNFKEVTAAGAVRDAGPAPYLDYRAELDDDERQAVEQFIATNPDLQTDAAADAVNNYAVNTIIPTHLAEVRDYKIPMIAKIREAVKIRLESEQDYYQKNAERLTEQAKKTSAAGQQALLENTINEERRKAEDCAARLRRRNSELENEEFISPEPPRLNTIALIIPRGLLKQLLPVTAAEARVNADASARQQIEAAAMAAVIKLERQRGNEPQDVSAANCGYDIETTASDGKLSFIEVKGRARGAATVTVSRNELYTALNQPERYILALVEIDGEQAQIRYLGNPFAQALTAGAKAKNDYIGNFITRLQTFLNNEAAPRVTRSNWLQLYEQYQPKELPAARAAAADYELAVRELLSNFALASLNCRLKELTAGSKIILEQEITLNPKE